jgi:hypothetical protein
LLFNLAGTRQNHESSKPKFHKSYRPIASNRRLDPVGGGLH